MRVGVGLPSTVAGASPELMLEWAKRAERGPFDSLGVVDRVAYNCYEPMALLSACAPVTQRLGLVTMIIIGPLRSNAGLAKQAASLHGVSGGRLVLGVGLGARRDDYEATGTEYARRGRRFAEQLADLKDHWEDPHLCPETAASKGPELIVGGGSDISLARVARFADGYVHGGGPPRAFARTADKLRAVWADAGRPGPPRLWAQGYYALGDEEIVERGVGYMRDYYAFTGPFAERIAEGLLTTPQAITAFLRGYSEAGCDELVLLPAVAELDQVERLGEAVAR